MFWHVPLKKPRCSFCNRAEEATGELISSPINDQLTPPPDHLVYICADCIAICNQLISDRHEEVAGIMSEEAPLTSEASSNDDDDDSGPVLLPNGMPLRLRRWVRQANAKTNDQVKSRNSW